MVLLAMVALAAFSTFGQPEYSFESSEVKFADASPSGLSIIPASCPSSPHYAGECSSVSISVSPTSIPYLGTTYVSWSASGVSSCSIYTSDSTHGLSSWQDGLSGSNVPAGGLQRDTTFTIRCDSGTYVSSATVQVAPPPPTCSITSILPSSINQGSGTTVSWSSSNATHVRIFDSLGTDYNWFLPTGSPVWYPSSSRSYRCYGYNSSTGVNGAWSSWASVTVIPPPTATISASPASINVGQSTTIRATFAVGSGDSMTGSAINQPYYTSVTPTTPVTPRTYTFTPSSPGTYTFYAFVNTPRYSWLMAKSVDVTVSVVIPPPTATISASPASINVGQSTTITATYAAGSGDTITGTAINQPYYTSVTPTTPVTPRTYTFTPSSPGTYTFYAFVNTPRYSWVNPASVTVQVGCAPATTWSCPGPGTKTIASTTVTSQCTTATTNTTCIGNGSCVVGSSTCFYPAPAFIPTPAANLTGHLEVRPSLVQREQSTRLYWNVDNVTSCTVTGTNGQQWGTPPTYADAGCNGTSCDAGASGKTSLPITGQTLYTLTCTPFTGAPAFTPETKTVNLAPVFEEL